MSIAKKRISIALAGLASLAIPAVAFAQAGGGTELPSSAEKKSTKDSTEKSQDQGSMKKDGGSMEKSDSMKKNGDKM